jgi:hypothetical protein
MYLTSSSMKIIVINTKNNTRIKVHLCKKVETNQYLNPKRSTTKEKKKNNQNKN